MSGSTGAVEVERHCRVCGVVVGRILLDGHWRFVPTEACALPIGDTYRCWDHAEKVVAR
jgi:hypothetical protein